MQFSTGFRSDNRVKNNWLMFWIIQYGLLLNIVNVNHTAANKVCRRFKRESEDILPYGEMNDTVLEKCPPSSSPFSVYTAKVTGNVKTHKALLICWGKNVRSFALQFDHSVSIDSASSTPGLRTRSCTHDNDTMVYDRRYSNRYTYHLTLQLTVPEKVQFAFRAYYSQKNHDLHQKQNKLIQYKCGSVSEAGKRRKREANTVLTLNSTPASQCGITRSCHRDGKEGCDHFNCTYFISYNVSLDNVDVEISAKTTGWVAIGFSSDRNMGGDEVIACKKVRTKAEAATYKNPYSHDYPRKKSGSNVISLKQYRIQDGYIYCHFTRSTSVKGYQDLTNEWHQLYAYGPLSAGGDLEKHTTTPHVSRKMSIVTRTNEYSNCTGGFVCSSLFVLLLAGFQRMLCL